MYTLFLQSLVDLKLRIKAGGKNNVPRGQVQYCGVQICGHLGNLWAIGKLVKYVNKWETF